MIKKEFSRRRILCVARKSLCSSKCKRRVVSQYYKQCSSNQPLSLCWVGIGHRRLLFICNQPPMRRQHIFYLSTKLPFWVPQLYHHRITTTVFIEYVSITKCTEFRGQHISFFFLITVGIILFFFFVWKYFCTTTFKTTPLRESFLTSQMNMMLYHKNHITC